MRRRLTGVVLSVSSTVLVALVGVASGAGDGDLDTSFGSGGSSSTDFGRDEFALAITFQPDGRILAGGWTSDTDATGQAVNSDFAIARFLPNGSLDTTFGTGGRVSTDVGGNGDSIASVAVQRDGAIVAVGGNDSAFAVVRYLTSGSLDPAFDGDGKLSTGFGGESSAASSVVVQTDGKIVVAGSSTTAGAADMAIARYTTAGVLDATFDGDGKKTIDFGGNEAAARIAIGSGGELVVAGVTTPAGGGNRDVAVARLTSGGALDATFSGDGKATFDIAAYDSVGGVAVLSTGKVIVGGGAGATGSTRDFMALRLTSSGALDPGFDGDGKATVPLGGLTTRTALAPDGKLVMTGTPLPSGGTVVARLTTDGAPDTSFSGDGTALIAPAPGVAEGGFSLGVRPDGRIVVGGWLNVGTTSDGYPIGDMKLWRLRGSYEAGLLRVVSSPAVPTQISVDGVWRDSWGLTWVSLPPGEYTVSFSHFEGFSDPLPQTVSVVAGQTTTVTGTFVQRGSLQVTTGPGASGIDAAISVDGVPRDNWGLFTDVPVGSHQVCFGAAAGYTAPACQQVNVGAGALTSLTGTYTVTPGATGPTGVGALRVTTSPARPSQVVVDGVWRNTYGLNWVWVPPGPHTVGFTHVEGYTEPADQPVTVVAGQTTTVNGTFVQRGFLKVNTAGPLFSGVNAAVSVDGVPRNNYGVWTDVPTGVHEVCFGDLAGLAAPSCQTVTVNAGSLTTLTGTYT